MSQLSSLICPFVRSWSTIVLPLACSHKFSAGWIVVSSVRYLISNCLHPPNISSPSISSFFASMTKILLWHKVRGVRVGTSFALQAA